MTRVLGVILARGGSVRLPGKNIRPLGGVPLIAWTIRVGRLCGLDRLMLSTDCKEIADVGAREGADVPFIRPADLATSQSTSLDAVLHAVDSVGGAEIVVLLQPTSPFRRPSDVDATLSLVTSGTPAAVSVCEMPIKWNTLLAVSADGVATRPSVDVEPTHHLNGAVYAVRTDVLRSARSFLPAGTKVHVMAPIHSIDIDTIEDFARAESALESGLIKPAW
jgi:CMP-N-acetylneuraminic acid synthetase